MNLQYILSRIIRKMHFSAIKNSEIPKTSKVEAGSTVVNTVFGEFSFCGYDCNIENAMIGSFTSIADNVRIGGARHPYEWASTSPVFYRGRDSVRAKFSKFAREEEPKTIVGNDVWIGANVLIKSGIFVGNGAVIGMGSVVTKDVEPYSIVAGNPARHIKYRFDQEDRNLLSTIQWWSKDIDVIKEAAKEVRSIERFIECFKNGN